MPKLRQLCCFPWVGIIVSGRFFSELHVGRFAWRSQLKYGMLMIARASVRAKRRWIWLCSQDHSFFLRSQRVHYFPPLAVWMHCSMCRRCMLIGRCRLRRREVYSLAVCSLTCSSATIHAGIPAWCFYFFRTTLPHAGIAAHVFQLML